MRLMGGGSKSWQPKIIVLFKAYSEIFSFKATNFGFIFKSKVFGGSFFSSDYQGDYSLPFFGPCLEPKVYTKD